MTSRGGSFLLKMVLVIIWTVVAVVSALCYRRADSEMGGGPDGPQAQLAGRAAGIRSSPANLGRGP